MAKAGETLIGWVVALAVLFGIVQGIDAAKTYLSASDTPQALEIDGQSAVACHGATVRNDGGMLAGDTFRVEYTDSDGLKHSYRGVRKLRVDDVPKTVKSTVPATPSLTDQNDKDYVVGNVYSWANGWKGKFRSYDNVAGDDGKPMLMDGKPIHTGTNWESVDEPNLLCASTRR